MPVQHIIAPDCGRMEEFQLENEMFAKLNRYINNYLDPAIEVVEWHNKHNIVLRLSEVESIMKPNKLIIASWSYRRPSKTGAFARQLRTMRVCNDDIYLPINDEISEHEYVYTANDVPMMVYNKQYNIVYLLWDASHGDGYAQNSFNIILNGFNEIAKKFNGQGVFVEHEIEVKPNLTIPGAKLALSKEYSRENIEKRIKRFMSEVRMYTTELSDANRKLALERQRWEALSFNKEAKDIPITNAHVMHVEVGNETLNVFTKPIYLTELNWEKFLLLLNEKHRNKWSTLPGFEPIEEDSDGDDEDYDDEDDGGGPVHDAVYRDERESGVDALGNLVDNIRSNLKIEPTDTLMVFLGRYNIDINLRRYEVNFHNMTQTQEGFWGHSDNHPHVSGDGNPCMGDMAEMVAFAMSENNVGLVIDAAIQFLQSANVTDSAGCKVVNWPLIKRTASGEMFYVITGEPFVEPDESSQILKLF